MVLLLRPINRYNVLEKYQRENKISGETFKETCPRIIDMKGKIPQQMSLS